MMKYITVAVALLVPLATLTVALAFALPASDTSCTAPFTAVGLSCLYFANDFTLDHTEAQLMCKALDSKLVVINRAQKLHDIVDYIHNNYNNLQKSYWIDGGRNSYNRWSFENLTGFPFPMGTPFWGTTNDNYGYEQRPLNDSNSGDCLVIPYDKSFYFTETLCDSEISSPLCEPEPESCGGDIVGIQGEISSPGYPNPYPYHADCRWTVTSPEGTTIRVHIKDFSTHSNDYLVIRDGIDSNAPELFRDDYYLDNYDDVFSTNNSLYVNFTSTYSYTPSRRGFNLNWVAELGITCPPPYTKIGGDCFAFVFSPETFNEAKISCASMNGQLGKITNIEQLRKLYIYIHDSGIADDSFWIGGSDKNMEGKFLYEDDTDVPQGTPFWGTTGENSEIQEPDGKKSENCVALLAEGRHFLRDVPCTSQFKYLCSPL